MDEQERAKRATALNSCSSYEQRTEGNNTCMIQRSTRSLAFIPAHTRRADERLMNDTTMVITAQQQLQLLLIPHTITRTHSRHHGTHTFDYNSTTTDTQAGET